MHHIKLSTQTFIIVLTGLTLTPRLLSSVAFGNGTLAILLFWIAILVILPDLIEGFETDKKRISEFPKILLITSLFCILMSSISFYLKNVIYDKNADFFLITFRRSLYLINPAICLALIPMIKPKKLSSYLKKIFLILLACSLTSIIPLLVGEKGWIIDSLINSTTFIAAFISDIITSYDISIVDNIYYLGDSRSIQVGSACASVSQIAFALQTIMLFAICCPIRNKIIYFPLLVSSFLIAFLINAIRIFLLGIITSNEVFEFWHSGQGSLIFSLIVMTFVSILYYHLWSKENPEVSTP